MGCPPNPLLWQVSPCESAAFYCLLYSFYARVDQKRCTQIAAEVPFTRQSLAFPKYYRSETVHNSQPAIRLMERQGHIENSSSYHARAFSTSVAICTNSTLGRTP